MKKTILKGQYNFGYTKKKKLLRDYRMPHFNSAQTEVIEKH